MIRIQCADRFLLDRRCFDFIHCALGSLAVIKDAKIQMGFLAVAGRRIWRLLHFRSSIGPRSQQRDSQYFEDAVDRPISSAMADADGDNAIDPIVFRRRGLEQRIDPKIIARRIYHLAFVDSRHNIGRTMTHTAVRHAYQSVVHRPEDKPYIQCHGAITTDRLPIAATVQHFSGQPISLK
jgi:hypothetical protein